MKAKQKTYTPQKLNRSGKSRLSERFLIHSHFVTFRLLSTLRVTAIGACTLSAVL